LSDKFVDAVQYYYKFELPEGKTYKAGWHISLLPRCHHDVVATLFKNKCVYLDEECKNLATPGQLVKVTPAGKEGSSIPLSGSECTAWNLIA